MQLPGKLLLFFTKLNHSYTSRYVDVEQHYIGVFPLTAGAA